MDKREINKVTFLANNSTLIESINLKFNTIEHENHYDVDSFKIFVSKISKLNKIEWETLIYSRSANEDYFTINLLKSKKHKVNIFCYRINKEDDDSSITLELINDN